MKLIIRAFVVSLIFAVGAYAQQFDAFKKEVGPLQAAVDEAVSAVIPGPAGIMTKSRATYLDGYGVVVMLEVMLEANRNPFSSPKTPNEVRATVAQRTMVVRNTLETLLKDRVQKLKCLADTDSLTIAIQLFNSNPADVPDLPIQLVMSVKKSDVTQVAVREIK